jgi:adenylate cyclase
MKLPARTFLAPILVGLGTGLVVLGAAYLLGHAALRMETAASDLLFVDENGPELGRRAASADIVLVLIDEKSTTAMKRLPKVEDDLALYRKLLDAGAAVVADVRMLAETGSPEDTAVGKLLDGMEKLNATDRLFRDVWVSPAWPIDLHRKYRPLIAHNLLNMHTNIDPFFASRIYPLAVAKSDGVYETIPLRLARVVLKLPAVGTTDVIANLNSSGIAARWATAFPGKTPVPAEMLTKPEHDTPYPLADGQLPWLPFRSQSSLAPPGGYWISYDAPVHEYRRVSYVDALHASDEEARQFRDKIVLVGYDASSDPTSDTYASPSTPRSIAAAEAVAAAVQTLLDWRVTRPQPTWWMVMVTLAAGVIAACLARALRPSLALLSITALLIALLTWETMLYRHGWFADVLMAPLACVLAGSASAAGRYLREIRLRMRITDLFGRYVPRAVVHQLMQKPDAEALALGGVKREVTVLFADIRGFTRFSEQHGPEEVLAQLNALLGVMVDCTFAHGGTLDKFIGDAILVLFNAPMEQVDHSLRAARTAWAIQQGIKNHPSGLGVGIGVHRGLAIVGTVGTPERLEYTAIGSTVNLASRLCGVAESGQILISDAAAAELDGHFQLESQPPMQLKGIQSEVKASELLGPAAS